MNAQAFGLQTIQLDPVSDAGQLGEMRFHFRHGRVLGQPLSRYMRILGQIDFLHDAPPQVCTIERRDDQMSGMAGNGRNPPSDRPPMGQFQKIHPHGFSEPQVPDGGLRPHRNVQAWVKNGFDPGVGHDVMTYGAVLLGDIAVLGQLGEVGREPASLLVPVDAHDVAILLIGKRRA